MKQTLLLLLLAVPSLALTQDKTQTANLPANAGIYLPMQKKELETYWPDYGPRSTFAAQVEQETCPSFKSKRCWSPTTELKTDREYGFGLGQITVTKKFDNFVEARKLDVSLRDWKWEDRYDPAKQLRTQVLTNRGNYRALIKLVPHHLDAAAMMFAAYNGGLGGVLQERRLCAAVKGCDPNVWFDNVALYSKKSKVKYQGYGQSFFEINRGYVENIMHVRLNKYRSFYGE
jgi:hypothetical protein